MKYKTTETNHKSCTYLCYLLTFGKLFRFKSKHTYYVDDIVYMCDDIWFRNDTVPLFPISQFIRSNEIIIWKWMGGGLDHPPPFRIWPGLPWLVSWQAWLTSVFNSRNKSFILQCRLVELDRSNKTTADFI